MMKDKYIKIKNKAFKLSSLKKHIVDITKKDISDSPEILYQLDKNLFIDQKFLFRMIDFSGQDGDKTIIKKILEVYKSGEK